jgi:hypothetical protein
MKLRLVADSGAGAALGMRDGIGVAADAKGCGGAGKTATMPNTEA